MPVPDLMEELCLDNEKSSSDTIEHTKHKTNAIKFDKNIGSVVFDDTYGVVPKSVYNRWIETENASVSATTSSIKSPVNIPPPRGTPRNHPSFSHL